MRDAVEKMKKNNTIENFTKTGLKKSSSFFRGEKNHNKENRIKKIHRMKPNANEFTPIQIAASLTHKPSRDEKKQLKSKQTPTKVIRLYRQNPIKFSANLSCWKVAMKGAWKNVLNSVFSSFYFFLVSVFFLWKIGLCFKITHSCRCNTRCFHHFHSFIRSTPNSKGLARAIAVCSQKHLKIYERCE